MKRKYLWKMSSVILLVCMMLSLFAGCGGSTNKPNDSANTDQSQNAQEPKKVALILAGNLGDKSFNDLGNSGLQKAKEEFGDRIEVKVLESPNQADYEPNVVAMAEAGYDLIIGLSTNLQPAIENTSPKYPNTLFALNDGVLKDNGLKNQISIQYAQNQSAFLMGAAAAMFADRPDFPRMNDKKTVGFIGGMDIPVIRDFYAGYEQGVKYIDPDMKILLSFVGSFNDPVKGKELAISQFSQGASIIYAAAASSGLSAIEYAAQENKVVVGGDFNRESLYPGTMMFSHLKHSETVVYSLCESLVEGTLTGGQTMKFDLANGGVGISDMAVIKEMYGDKFPSEIPEKLKQITEDIINGKIKVNHGGGYTD